MNNKPLIFFISLMTLALILIVTYQIKTDPFKNIKPKTVQQNDTSHQPCDIIALYSKNCAVCHGSFGQGQGSNPALKGTNLSHDQIAQLIRSGKGEMPSFSNLTGDQIHQLVELIEKF